MFPPRAGGAGMLPYSMSEPSLHEFVDWIEDTDGDYPVVSVTVYYVYQRELDEDIETFVDRQGWRMIPAAVEGTMDYLKGRATRRMAASDMGVGAVEGMMITQAVERVISVVGDSDPDIDYPADVDVQLTRDTTPIIRLVCE